MRTERIGSTHLIKESVTQLTLPIQVVNTENPPSDNKEADSKQNLTPAQTQTTSPAQDAAILREASVFKRNDNYLFILPKQYVCDVFEGNGKLDSNGNFIVIIVGPFGSGKNSVVNNAIKKASDHIQQVVEHTTRQRRPGKTEGVEYYFVTKDKFQKMAESDEFLVWGNLTGNDYGYAVKSIQEALDNGKIPILIQGPNNSGPTKTALEKRNVSTIVAFISPLSQEELSSDGGIDKAIEILEKRMEGTERNKLKERSLISRAMFESLPQDIALIENSNGNLEQATINLLSLIQAKKDEIISNKVKNARQLFVTTGEISEEYFKVHNLKANGNIIVLATGPSGAGKGTILEQALKEDSINLAEAVTCTTRGPRKNEVEGIDYYFKTKEEFEKMIENNELIEWALVHNGKYYGYPEKPTQEKLDTGKNIVFELDVTGKDFYKAAFKGFNIPCVDVFISPVPKEDLQSQEGIEKAIEILRERIRKRAGNETPEQIEERMKIAKEWLTKAHKYSYIIENIDGRQEEATKEFINIIKRKI